MGLHEVAWGSRVGGVTRRGLNIELWGVLSVWGFVGGGLEEVAIG